jgi:glutamate synthase (NADPH/NADH) large chain
LSFRDTADPGTPSARGLYDPALDKDSCGVGFIADLKGRKSHKIIDDGLTILLNLEHRGGHRCKYAPNIDPHFKFGASS